MSGRRLSSTALAVPPAVRVRPLRYIRRSARYAEELKMERQYSHSQKSALPNKLARFGNSFSAGTSFASVATAFALSVARSSPTTVTTATCVLAARWYARLALSSVKPSRPPKRLMNCDSPSL